MERLSEATYRMLMRQGLARRTVGAVETSGIGDVASAGKSALPHQLAGEGHNQPMGMGSGKGRGRPKPAPVQQGGSQNSVGETTLQTAAIATKKGARIIREAPFLLIMDGGLA